jgi:hypothetical protein
MLEVLLYVFGFCLGEKQLIYDMTSGKSIYSKMSPVRLPAAETINIPDHIQRFTTETFPTSGFIHINSWTIFFAAMPAVPVPL